MDDLVDRLAVLVGPPTRELDVEALRGRVGRRRRRHRAALGAAGLALIVTGVAATRALTDDGPGTDRIDAAAPTAASVPMSWGGPVDLDAGDGVVYVTFSTQGGADVGGGIARLDPATGELVALTELDDGVVEYGGGVLWALPGNGSVRQLDPADGAPLGEVPLPDGEHVWRIAGDADGLWVVLPGEVLHLTPGSPTPERVAILPTGPHFTEPIAVGDDLWFGQDDGLVRVSRDGTVVRYDGPETGDRIYALAPDSDGLWVGASASADAPSTVGRLDPDGPTSAPLADTVTLQGTANEIGVLDGELCASVNSMLLGQVVACGAIPADGAPQLELVPGAADAATAQWLAVDGAWWSVDWSDAAVHRLAPSTLAVDTVVDLPFDGSAAIEQRYAPIGDEVEVMSGDLPDDLGRWTLVVYRTEVGICNRLDTRFGGGGGCSSEEDSGRLRLTTSDGSGDTGLPPDATAQVAPEVARVRFLLDDGQVVTVEPVDVGFERNFAYSWFPAGTRLVRAEALAVDGTVLEVEPGPPTG